MPQLDPAVFPTQIFWLIVTFALLFLVLWRGALPKISSVLEARRDHIANDLGKAASIKEEAEKVLAEYEKALAEARNKATAALKQTAQKLGAESTERQQAFNQELLARTKEAEARIDAAKTEALGNLKVVAVEAAGAATVKLIGTGVNADDVRKMVDAVMAEEAGETHGGRG